jgi:hypothetical protein
MQRLYYTDSEVLDINEAMSKSDCKSKLSRDIKLNIESYKTYQIYDIAKI